MMTNAATRISRLGTIKFYCIVLYCIVLYCIVLYCIVLYCIVLYCIVLYCIVLNCTFCCYVMTNGCQNRYITLYRQTLWFIENIFMCQLIFTQVIIISENLKHY